MNMIDKAVSIFSPERGLRRIEARAALSAYDAAGYGRRNEGWVKAGRGADPNLGLSYSLVTLRARARDMVRNNAYASSALKVYVSQLFGSNGFQASMMPEAFDADDAEAEAAKMKDSIFKEWANSTDCDYDGQNNFYGMQSMIGAAWKQDGEVLVVQYVDKRMKFPLKLRVLEADMIDDSKQTTQDDNTITMQGIVFDRKNGGRVGYWLFDSHPGANFGAALTSKYVPADRVIHFYKQERPGMIRGIPAGVASMTHLKNIGDFQDARIEQQKVAACMMGVIRRDGETVRPNEKIEPGDLLPEKIEPGMLLRLNPWEDVTFSTPPTTQGHAEFLSFELHAVAADWGITYEMLTGDYSGVNFTSGRMGYAKMNAIIKAEQEQIIKPKLLNPVGKWFDAVYSLVYSPSIVTPINWTAPAFAMVDETRQLPALRDAIRAGLVSPFSAIESLGRDPRKLVNDYKQWNTMLDQFGIKVDSDARNMTAQGQAQDTQNATGGDDDE